MSVDEVRDEGAKALAQALKTNSTLQQLNLTGRWGKGNVWFHIKDPQPAMSEAGSETKSHK